MRPRVASAIATTGVLAYAAVAPRLGRRHAALTAASASAIALGAARAWGVSIDALGLAPSRFRRGAAVGVAVALPIAVGVVAGSRHPSTRRFFADARVVELDDRHAAYELLVRIPVVTAATEELLFRSVLLGITSQWLGVRRAALWTSVVFGVWHVVPALHSHRHNAAAAGAVDGVGGRTALVAGTVAATSVAGLGLCGLRLRTKSVVAPMVVHAAINGAAFAASRVFARDDVGSVQFRSVVEGDADGGHGQAHVEDRPCDLPEPARPDGRHGTRGRLALPRELRGWRPGRGRRHLAE